MCCIFKEPLWIQLSLLFRHARRWRWAPWMCLCSLTAHSHTAHSAWCLSTRLGGKYNFTLPILSPVMFSRWSPVRTTQDPLRIILRSTSSVFRLKTIKPCGKNQMSFALWRKWDKISTVHINCCLELQHYWQADDVLVSEQKAPLFFSSVVADVAWSKDAHWSKTLNLWMTGPSFVEQIIIVPGGNSL